ncbi:MAG: HEAT repeat domain-containing protein, partial [Spirochaetaceae bacterium]|nr:HEAT repeat domain-containing protein [Spirochaetaceae bacterium]
MPLSHRVFRLCMLAALWLSAGIAAAQPADTEEDWVLPQRELLRREIRYARALVPELHSKLGVIAELGDRARAGGLSPEDADALRILRYLAGEGTITLKRGPVAAARGFPEARRASCEVLGLVGGDAAREILLEVLKTEPQPMVLAEAAFALGKITPEPRDDITALFRYLLETKVLVPGADNNLAMALLTTLDKFADSRAGIRDEDL